MAHLKLNGWTIPVRSGGGRDHRVVGDETTVIDGTMHKDRRGIFRKWSMTAIRQIPKDAEALIATLLANGQDWPFDADLFSGKGVAVSGSAFGALRPGVAADGADVFDVKTDIQESKFGVNSLAVEPAITNLLTGDSSDAENTPTGFSAIAGATLVDTTDFFLQGSKSAKVSYTGAGDGIETASVSADPTTTYVGHVYVYSETADNITVKLIDDIGDIDSVGQLLNAGVWNRYELSGTSDGSATGIQIQVIKGGSGSGDFFCDAFQIVEGTLNTGWVRGGTSRVNGDLEYPPTIMNGGGDAARAWKAITVAMWARGPTTNPATQKVLFLALGAGGLDTLQIIRSASTNNIQATLITSAGVSVSVTESGSPWDDDWHHVAATVYLNKATGNAELRLYFDGVESGSVTTSGRLDFSKVASVWVGNNQSTQQWAGLIDALLVVPFAAPVAQVLAWSNETTALPALRKLRASGDFAPEDSVDVWGMPGEAVNAPFFDGTTQHNAALEIPFALEEG